MFVSNSDIYTPEWIELVFENRNKAYGAYDLRKHYAKNLLKAFGLAALFFGGIFVACLVVFKQQPVNRPVEFTNTPIKTVQNTINITSPTNLHNSNTGAIHSATRHLNRFANHATSHIVSNNSAAVGGISVPAENRVVVNNAGNTTIQPGELSITEKPVVEANTMKSPPQPLEGANEWAAFLKRTLVYPSEAHRAGIMGKVWLSFVVEKDGSINDIKVLKPAGYGFDEEAVRVLKLAPSWRPGIQNGQAVRVKYILPIEFRITP